MVSWKAADPTVSWFNDCAAKQNILRLLKVACNFCYVVILLTRWPLVYCFAGETVVFDPEPACKTLFGPVLSSYYCQYVWNDFIFLVNPQSFPNTYPLTIILALFCYIRKGGGSSWCENIYCILKWISGQNDSKLVWCLISLCLIFIIINKDTRKHTPNEKSNFMGWNHFDLKSILTYVQAIHQLKCCDHPTLC